jgi:hypothetical protein
MMATSGTDDRIIEAGDGRAMPAQTLCAVLIGCVVAAILGSAPLLGWTEALPDGLVASVAHDAASRWNDAMSRFGTTEPRAWLRAEIRLSEASRFQESAASVGLHADDRADRRQKPAVYEIFSQSAQVRSQCSGASVLDTAWQPTLIVQRPPLGSSLAEASAETRRRPWLHPHAAVTGRPTALFE